MLKGLEMSYEGSMGTKFAINLRFFTADEILPVGSIRVNSLNDLILSPALKDLLDFSLTRQNSGPRPILNTKSKVFELDNCRNIGKVSYFRTKCFLIRI